MPTPVLNHFAVMILLLRVTDFGYSLQKKNPMLNQELRLHLNFILIDKIDFGLCPRGQQVA
jgi:predicted ATP-binding protein involved in virulence